MSLIRLGPREPSRRTLLRIGAATLGMSVLNSGLAANNKLSQSAVGYQNAPHGAERCETCAPFLPPDQCRTVAGPVGRHGWCRLYQGA